MWQLILKGCENCLRIACARGEELTNWTDQQQAELAMYYGCLSEYMYSLRNICLEFL